MRTSEEGSRRTANTRVEGLKGIGDIRGQDIVPGRRIVGLERDWLEITSEQIRRSVLEGEVGSEGEEREESCGGEQCPFSLSEWGGEMEGKSVAAALITEEGFFRGANRESHD